MNFWWTVVAVMVAIFLLRALESVVEMLHGLRQRRAGIFLRSGAGRTSKVVERRWHDVMQAVEEDDNTSQDEDPPEEFAPYLNDEAVPIPENPVTIVPPLTIPRKD